MELIDRDALLTQISQHKIRKTIRRRPSLTECATFAWTKGDIYGLVLKAPTVYAVKHGTWVVVDETEPRRYGCSVCRKLSFDETNYCSYCGAKMDGVYDGEEQNDEQIESD